ncbi:MAG: hypothetical protein VCC00_11580 [Deltaproteobacteria bacterium]
MIQQKLPLLLALILLGGCAVQIARPTAPEGPSLATASATELLGVLRGRESALRSLDALGKIRVEAPQGGRFRASQVVMAMAPAAFRIEVLAPFGISYVVASDGQQLATLATQENSVHRGPATALSIQLTTGVAADGEEITALLLGRPPVAADALRSTWTSRPSGRAKAGAAEVFLHAADGASSVVIGFARVVVERSLVAVPVSFQRIARNGERLLKASFKDFAGKKGVLIPRRIHIEAAGSSARIEYRDFEPNKPLPASAFLLATPPGMQEFALPTAAPAAP